MRRDIHVDFVGRHRLWFSISLALVIISLAALGLRGLNLSIDFVGGTSFTLTGVEQEVSSEELADIAEEAGGESVRAQTVRDGTQVTGAIVQTEAIEPGSELELGVEQALVEATGAEEVQVSFVGPTWGEHISSRMLQALLVFLLIAVAYMSIRLEFKMAMTSLVALFHDVVIAMGVYALFQFQVSPPTVIAYLTILGYSLYDTVIVFDRVVENTDRLGGPGRRSYGQAVNTSMNDVLWRSVNTTVSSTLPVAGLLFIGSQLLGAATLLDLALALFIGMLAGAYSSLFLAGPLLAVWREREPRLAEMKRRAQLRDDDDDEPGDSPPVSRGKRARLEEGVGGGTVVTTEDAEVDAPQREPESPRDSGTEGEEETPGYVRGRGKKPRRKRR